MAQYHPPPPLNFQEPNWEQFISQFKTYRFLTELDKKSGKIQDAGLKYCMGPESEEILKTFNFSDGEVDKYDEVVKEFESYFSPCKNVLRLRKQFYRQIQQSTEDTEAYLRALFVAAEHCKFHDKEESIRDQFVLGILDDELAEKIELLYYNKDGNLSLDDVVEYCRTYNDIHNRRKLEREQNTATKEIAVVQKEKKMLRDSEKAKSSQRCQYCGKSHLPRRCPAFGKFCNKCKERNHFANVCSQINQIQSADLPVEPLQIVKYYKCEERDGFSAFLGEVNASSKQSCEAMKVAITTGSRVISFKVDTGADFTILNKATGERVINRGGNLKLADSDRRLICPAGNLKIAGMVTIPMTYRRKSIREKVYVLEEEKYCPENLLSRGTALRVGSFLSLEVWNEKNHWKMEY